MCAPSPALLGIARDVIAALPSVPTNVGDPVNAMLLSSRYATFSPWPPVPTPEKPVMVPLALAVTGVKAALPNGDPLTLSVATPIVTMPLARLSAPCQKLPTIGVTV